MVLVKLKFQNLFLVLPNDVLTEIIKLLSLKDRESLGSINIRLHLLERNAGHRKFHTIIFNSVNITYVSQNKNNK